METLWQDIRYGLRVLVKSPGFTVVAVLTLALGIGANTAIFTAVNAVLLRSLPVQNPEQLALLSDPESHGLSIGSQSGRRDLFSYQEFEQLRDRNNVFSGIFAADSLSAHPRATVNGFGATRESEPIATRLVSGVYFSVLGVNPILGRAFTSAVDKTPGRSPFAVVSYRFWRSRFGLSPTALGSRIQIRQTSFEIIGVMPPEFFGEAVGESPDLWLPLTMQPAIFPGRDFLTPRKAQLEQVMWLQVMGRLKPGVTLAQAQAGINVTFQQILQAQVGPQLAEQDRRRLFDQQIALTKGGKGVSVIRGEFSEPLRLLMALVGLVLLIACANVANLLLARATARQKEVAVRRALGAGRARLVRQLLTESVLLALLGAGCGLLLAQWADTLLVRIASQGPQPIALDLAPDARILGFTATVALLTGILLGLVPAFRSTRLDLSPVLKGAARGIAGGGARGAGAPVGKILVVAQVAVSLLLLVVAGLFVRSLQKLSAVRLGYEREHLLLFAIDPVSSGYKGAAAARLQQRFLDRFAGIPGVRSVTLSSNGLFSHWELGDPISVEGYTPKSEEEMHARFDQVGPNYFATTGIPVLAGRDVGVEDSGNGSRACWINQTMARYYFSGANPIGKRIVDEYPDNRAECLVAGVVGDVKYNSLREQTPKCFYAPFFHPVVESDQAIFEVRVAGDAAAVVSSLHQAVKETDATLLAPAIHSMNELVDGTLVRDRLITRLSGFFGLVALLLACIGMYGVMSYAVSGRINEIGIRMALGAQRAKVIWMVLRETLLLVAVGLALGLPAVLAVTQLVSSLLFGLSTKDPASILLATALMVVVAALAGYLPARRVSLVDPIVALRYE